MIVDVYAGSYKYIELPCILECNSSLEASPSLEMVNLNVESFGIKCLHVCPKHVRLHTDAQTRAVGHHLCTSQQSRKTLGGPMPELARVLKPDA